MKLMAICCVKSNSTEPVLASVEMTTCPEASQKNPSGDEVVECNDLEKNEYLRVEEGGSLEVWVEVNCLW